MGKWWNQVLLGQRVKVRTPSDNLLGVIGAIPPHVLRSTQREKPVAIEEMFIDIGALSYSDAVSTGIRPGSPIVPCADFKVGAGGRCAIGKALDDRAGLGVILEVLQGKRRSGNTS